MLKEINLANFTKRIVLQCKATLNIPWYEAVLSERHIHLILPLAHSLSVIQ